MGNTFVERFLVSVNGYIVSNQRAVEFYLELGTSFVLTLVAIALFAAVSGNWSFAVGGGAAWFVLFPLRFWMRQTRTAELVILIPWSFLMYFVAKITIWNPNMTDYSLHSIVHVLFN
jgi:hypothetical protein